MGAEEPVQIGSDLLLVHEGTSDLHVLGSLMRHSRIEGFQTLSLDGHDAQKLRRFFKGLAASPHFTSLVPGFASPVRSLAIVLDAESDATKTFEEIREALMAANLPVPLGPGRISDELPHVGVFLLPDNESAGMIETLCLRSVQDDPAWNCIDELFECLRRQLGTLPTNPDKARAQAFLSTRPRPNLPVGLAALEGYWRFDSQAFEPLVGFLRALS